MIRQVRINELASKQFEQIALPLSLPDLDEVYNLAKELHKKGQEYRGQYKGWPVVYHPAETEIPTEDWSVAFAASFQLGIWPLWTINLDWENGPDQEPKIWTWDKNIVSA